MPNTLEAPPKPATRAGLPDELFWLAEKVESLVRPAAFFTQDKATVSPLGGTRGWGRPDLPADRRTLLRCLSGSPYDGECFWLQLNLADIPAAVRRPQWPTAGVVWVTIDLSGSWEGTAYFDPRPAEAIKWQARAEREPPKAACWAVADTLPCCTPQVLPEIWPTWQMQHSLVASYDEWAYEQYTARLPGGIQVGGWVWPCQGDFDERNETFVCGFERQPFGDSGAVYLHYAADRGFFVFVETH